MAQTVQELYLGMDMNRATFGGWVELKKVDKSNKSDAGDDEYFAQDFWVFYSQKERESMTYLKDILNEGAKADDVAQAIGDTERIKAYWDWAKIRCWRKISILAAHNERAASWKPGRMTYCTNPVFSARALTWRWMQP